MINFFFILSRIKKKKKKKVNKLLMILFHLNLNLMSFPFYPQSQVTYFHKYLHFQFIFILNYCFNY